MHDRHEHAIVFDVACEAHIDGSVHRQLVVGEGGIQKFELRERAYRGNGDHRLVGDGETLVGLATLRVEFVKDAGVDFDGDETVRCREHRNAHVLTHTTLTVGERDDDLFGRTQRDGAFRVASRNRPAGTGAGHRRGLDAPVHQDTSHHG